MMKMNCGEVFGLKIFKRIRDYIGLIKDVATMSIINDHGRVVFTRDFE